LARHPVVIEAASIMQDTHTAQYCQSFFPGQVASFQIVDQQNIRFQFPPEHNNAQFADAETKTLLRGSQMIVTVS
jgi:hypothetical protein